MKANNYALGVAEVSERYKVHPNTVRAMAKDGRLPHGKAGRDYRFSPHECDRVFLGIESKDDAA